MPNFSGDWNCRGTVKDFTSELATFAIKTLPCSLLRSNYWTYGEEIIESNPVEIVFDGNPIEAHFTPADTVATPTFSPSSGEYENNVEVNINTATEGATIKYTVDGSTPSPTNFPSNWAGFY